jgi:hypothetical protein
MIQSPKPIPRVSAKHYAPQPAPTAAKVRFRVKGEADGPVYQGQVVVVPCRSCGGKPRP